MAPTGRVEGTRVTPTFRGGLFCFGKTETLHSGLVSETFPGWLWSNKEAGFRPLIHEIDSFSPVFDSFRLLAWCGIEQWCALAAGSNSPTA